MLRCVVSLSLLAAALAFSNPVAFTRPTRVATQIFMFSGDTPGSSSQQDSVVDATTSADANGAPLVPESSSFAASTETKGLTLKNLSKGGEVVEVKWRDPALEANISPFQMEWWAYGLVLFPFILLANDFLHFLPTEGPLAFLNKT